MDVNDPMPWLQIVNTIVVTLTFLAVVIYVWKTWEMASATRNAAEATRATVEEMREARVQETAPHIIAYFDVPYGTHLIHFVIRNVGKSTARDVTLSFSPPLRASSQDLVDGLEFLREGFASMPPDYEFRTFLDSTVQYLADETLPLDYDVSIEYSGGLMEERMLQTVRLSLGAIRGRMFTTQKGIHDLATSFESLCRQHQRATGTLGSIAKALEQGVFIRNPSLAITDVSIISADEWKAYVCAKLNEFALIWAKSSGTERSTGTGTSALQTRIDVLSDQIVVLLAQKPEDVNDAFATEVSAFLEQMAELTHTRFYTDGGKSLGEFNQLGDDLVTRIVSIQVAPGSNA